MRTDQKLFCLKCVLSIFLVILWVLGSTIFGVLLWLRLDFWTNEYLELNNELNRYLILLYVSLVDGALILVFSLFGLVGGLKTIKWALVVYLTAMCLTIVLTISGSVYGFVYREELQNTVGRSDLIKNVVTQDFTGEPLRKVTRAVNIMQSELQCCGGDGPRDYIESNWAQQNHEGSTVQYAPPSCCKDYLRHENEKSSCPIYALISGSSQEQNLNPGINAEGCKTALSRFFEKYVIVVAGVVITIGILQLVCIIVTSILIHVLNNLYVPQPDDIVYDMARNQEKSPYPSRGDYYR